MIPKEIILFLLPEICGIALTEHTLSTFVEGAAIWSDIVST